LASIQSLIGSPIDASGTDLATAKSLSGVHVGIAIPLFFLDLSNLKIRSAALNKVATTTYENSQINLKGQYEQAIQI
jgi:hypothetical protein